MSPRPLALAAAFAALLSLAAAGVLGAWREQARALEEAALRGWPSLERVDEGGWVLRFSGGYTRRANSAAALAAGEADLDARIAWCEREYAARGLPPIFRILSTCGPPRLDAALEAAGYAREGEALVMTRALAPGDGPGAAALRPLDLDAWLDVYDRCGERPGAGRAVHRALLESVRGERVLAALEDGGALAGCGVGVRDGGLAGLFDLAVAPAERGRGLGRRLVEALLGWAAGGGARTAYLQVLATNAAAIRLYERLGFGEAYRYWYRARPRPAP